MKVFTGKVVSTKMAKTAVVLVERMVIHPMYLKRYKKFKKYLVHDESGVQVGQIVSFVTCKPVSKTKKWKILEIKKQNSTGIEKKVVVQKKLTKKENKKK